MCHLCNTIHIARLCFDVMVFNLVITQWTLLLTVKYLPFLEDSTVFFRVVCFEANVAISIMSSTSLARKLCMYTNPDKTWSVKATIISHYVRISAYTIVFQP